MTSDTKAAVMALLKVLLCFLVWIAVARAAVHRIPVTRKHATHASINRLFKRAKGGVELTHFRDDYLTGNITVGTPPQTFVTEFDTGTADLWILDDTCIDYDCWNATVFHKNISKTYSIGDRLAHAQYDTGNYVSGVLSYDSVTFGGISLISQTFILVNETEGNEDIKSIFGLGSPRGGSPPFYTAVAQKAVDKPILTIFFEKNVDDTFGGEITFGDYDTKNCGPIYTTTQSVGTDWYLNITGASFDGVKLAWNGSFGCIDTRTSYVILPFNVDNLYAKINKTVKLTPNHEYHYPLYNLNCADAHKIPDLTIAIDDFDHIIKGYQLAAPNKDPKGTCLLALLHVPEYMNLGDPFTRDRCVSQNIKTMDISFAHRK